MYDRHIIIIIGNNNSNSSSAKTAAVSRWRQKPSDGKTFKVCIMPCCNSATLFFVVFSLCFCYRPEHQNRSIFNHDINAMGDSFFCIVPRDWGIDDICATEFYLNLLFWKNCTSKESLAKYRCDSHHYHSFRTSLSKQKLIPNGRIMESFLSWTNKIEITCRYWASITPLPLYNFTIICIIALTIIELSC